MLPPPESLDTAFRIGLVVCFIFGAICSIPSVWERFFKKDKDGLPLGGAYLKAGEYGETELNTSWSVFKEPLNSWTSLAYSVFGIAISYVGYVDYFTPTEVQNRMTSDAGFSMLIGSFCVYLGISSFFFHASHTEMWRKADAGMTSGICIPLAIFAIWDRTRLPGISCLVMMSLCSFMLFTLTHGYVPYGSSDILLPGTILIVWSLELLPRFGGAMHSDQYLYWLRCLFSVLGGALLRAIDVKRKAPKVKNILTVVYFVLLAIFGLLVGFVDDATLCGLVAGTIVLVNPARGHIFWHIASAYALFIWWYMLRIRPGNPETPYSPDNVLVNFILFIAVKNGYRRVVMNIPASILPAEYQDRIRLVVEHVIFAVWGFVTIVELPTVYHSWLFQPILCWFKPVYPNGAFMVYYTAKAASCVEDVLFLWWTGSTFSKHPHLTPSGAAASTSLSTAAAANGNLNSLQNMHHLHHLHGIKDHKDKGATLPGSLLHISKGTEQPGPAGAGTGTGMGARDDDADDSDSDPMRAKSALPSMSSRTERAEGEHMRAFHHNIAAMMAVASLFAGYAKIGSLVAFVHDICDIPLDLFKIFALKGWRRAQIIALAVTAVMYVYWRVWYFSSQILYTIAFESKNMIDNVNCTPGDCTWMDVPERAPFLMSLVVLLALNVVSLTRMVRVGYRILNPPC